MWSGSLIELRRRSLRRKADDAGIIVKRSGATCYLGEAAGRESSKGACKQQILWLAMRMTRFRKVCEHHCVHVRSFLIVALCLVLAAVRVAGTHAHLVHEHSAGSTTAIHHVVTMVDEVSPDHLLSHLFHGDLDADDSVQTVAKLFMSADAYAPALLLIVLYCLLKPRLALQIRAHRPELRPPPRRGAFHLTPPSHAPPAAP